ncbi:recombinase RecX [Tamilnaduibacter salinus]|uniref:Regulatory protein RecX n=1 Tax=Tamilnaduibacter salinus TaxID=1484056 RepID=A0A2A2I3N2_9GAMM|nr:regulatory protein RecX [Tamilnaduibacter salinus]PAV26329.1 recombinase RecX [Tamilnaduibacter salinus]
MAGISDSGDGEDVEHRLRSTALKMLARREHSRQEMFFKLIRRRFPEAVIDSVLTDFEAQGWLDDARFAEVYARQRRELNYGPLRIESELQQRGIGFVPEELKAMSDGDWVAHALDARKRRFGVGAQALEWDSKVRQARFLAQRGFTGEQAERALAVTAEDAE